jgi:hypothetical protein
VNRYAAWLTVVADGHDTLYMRESWLVRWHVFFVSSFRDWICTIQSRGGFVRRGPDRLKVAGCHYHGYSSEALPPLQVLVAWLNVQLCSNLTSVHGLLVCRPAPRVSKLADSAACHTRACKAPGPPPAQLLVPSTTRGVFLALRAICDAAESNVCYGRSAASHRARGAHERDTVVA